jgi:spermidine synthase
VDDANKRGAKVDVVLGDGRLSLENQQSQGYDVMFLDAFSGDAIPVHLLTKECFDQYKRHLQPDGVIAVHISNRHLDLQPVVLKLAQQFGFDYAIISDDPATRFDEDEEGNYDEWLYESDWVLLSSNKQFLQTTQIQAESSPARARKGIGLWTDDSTNLFQIMRVKD